MANSRPSDPPAAAPTLAELGRALGLDKSTVSLALRGSPRIAAETRRRVAGEARRRGYRPNLAARQLNGPARGPRLIALVLSGELESLSSALAVRAIQLLAAAANARGALCQLLPAGDRLDQAESDPAHPLTPDAAWIWGDVPRPRAERIAARGGPTLVIDPNHPSWRGADSRRLRLGNRAASELLVEHLAARGARRLLFVRGDDRHLGHLERRDAARDGWRRRGLDGFADCDLAGLDDARLRAIGGGHGAVLCSNDATALVVRHRLHRLGLRAPDDVRLAGYDGEPLALATGLTTAAFDHAALARTALAALLDDGPIGDVPATLRIGETT